MSEPWFEARRRIEDWALMHHGGDLYQADPVTLSPIPGTARRALDRQGQVLMELVDQLVAVNGNSVTQQDARAVALKVLAELAEKAKDEGVRLGAATQLAVTTKTE